MNMYGSGLNNFYPQMNTEILKVNGKDGANAFYIPANSSVLLLDTTQPVVWCKTTDQMGIASIKGYFITPIEDISTGTTIVDEPKPEYVTKKEFTELKEKLDKLLEDLNG